MSMLRIRGVLEPYLIVGTISSISRWVRMVLVPEVEMPHLKANVLSCESLRAGGILSAMHVDYSPF